MTVKMTTETIILVDDNIATLKAGKAALQERYPVITVPSAEKLFEALKQTTPQLILLDVDMPDTDGYETIRRLKSSVKTEQIPVIFLTGKSDPASELEGLRLGAVDYIAKPFLPELLNKRVEVHLTIELQRRQIIEQNKKVRGFNVALQEKVEEKTKDIQSLQTAILQTMADLVERRDVDTGGHIVRTQRYLRILLSALVAETSYVEFVDMGWDIDLLVRSSQLHDVGKIAVSDLVLKKTGKLTEEEFVEMKKHSLQGKEIIEHMMEISTDKDFLNYAKILAETHHEKWNGSGYPYGLKGKDIPLPGRLLAIVDVYDALVSERPYKKPYTHEEAVKTIVEGKGTHFDPDLIDVFERISGEFASVGKL
ncbi:two-component system response regulator [Synergistales bacterium]|nr:two-component system response regulator [Synergistales bacterium]